jgi:hypothetical protein
VRPSRLSAFWHKPEGRDHSLRRANAELRASAYRLFPFIPYPRGLGVPWQSPLGDGERNARDGFAARMQGTNEIGTTVL